MDGRWLALGGAAALAALSVGSTAGSANTTPLQQALLRLFKVYAKDPEVAIRTTDMVATAAASLAVPVAGVTSPRALLLRDVTLFTGERDPDLGAYAAELRTMVRDNDHFHPGVDLAVRTPLVRLVPWLAPQVRAVLRAERAGRLKVRRGLIIPNPRIPGAVQEAAALDTLSRMTRGLSRIADWASTVRPDLKAMTFAQAKRASDQWHAELAAKQRAKGVIAGRPFHTFDDGWTAQELTTRAQLRSEGSFLGHCVGTARGYWDGLERGAWRIFSIRDPDGIPQVTVTVNLDGRGVFKSVKEAKGREDRYGGLTVGATKRWAMGERQGIEPEAQECRHLMEFLEVLSAQAGRPIPGGADYEPCQRWKDELLGGLFGSPV